MHVSTIISDKSTNTALGAMNADILSHLLTIAAQTSRPTSICLSRLARNTGYSREELPAALEECNKAMMHCFQLPLLKDFDPQKSRRAYFSDALLGLSRMIPFFEYRHWLQPCGMPYGFMEE